MYRTLICLGLSLCLLTSAHSEELIWETLPLVGVAELKNGKPAEGVVYDLQRLVEQALPDLEHHYVISSPKRVIQKMASGAPRCTTLLLSYAEHDRVGYFVPFLQTLPMQLIVRSEMRGVLPVEGGQISLSQLLRVEGIKGAIAADRGYPPELQVLLDQGLASGRIQEIHSSSSGGNLLSMVSHGRLDYSLEFPLVVKRVTETTALPAPLEGIPIAENTQLSPAGLYCTRSAWGKAMAIRLDQAIRQIAADPEVLLALYRKTVDVPSFDHYEQQLRTYLEQRAHTPTNL